MAVDSLMLSPAGFGALFVARQLAVAVGSFARLPLKDAVTTQPVVANRGVFAGPPSQHHQFQLERVIL